MRWWSNFCLYSITLMPRNTVPRTSVAIRKILTSCFFPTCADQTAMAMVKLLMMRTTEAAFERALDEPDQKPCADNHVQGVQAGHAKIEGKIKLSVCVQVGIFDKSLLQLLLFDDYIAGFICGGGVRSPVHHVEVVAGNKVVVELLLVFDHFDAKEHGDRI